LLVKVKKLTKTIRQYLSHQIWNETVTCWFWPSRQRKTPWASEGNFSRRGQAPVSPRSDAQAGHTAAAEKTKWV